MPIIYSNTPEGEEICIIFVNFLKINNAVKTLVKVSRRGQRLSSILRTKLHKYSSTNELVHREITKT